MVAGHRGIGKVNQVVCDGDGTAVAPIESPTGCSSTKTPLLNTTEVVSIEDIQALVRQGCTDWKQYGFVVVRQSGDLLIFNYTQEAQFEGRWNFLEVVSRGLIVHAKTGEIVARPFDKFFNWFEGGRKANGHIVTVTEKMDGSLGILYRDNGRCKIATRGSFDGEQAQWATAYLNAHWDLTGMGDEWTFLFEIIYPGNRIVVDYGNREDLVLLAIRNRHTGEYLPFYPDVYINGLRLGFSLPKTFEFNNVAQIIEQGGVLDANQEGWVVEFSDGQRFKFKGDKYVELHRLISGLSFKNTLAAVQSGTVGYIREQIPDEFLTEFNQWVDEINTTVITIKTECAAVFEQCPKDSRKDFALYVTGNWKQYAPYLFSMLDGREIEPLIYRTAFREREVLL